MAITFTTQAYSYLEPGVDTLDFTTTSKTNAYLSKVVCADEATLDEQGPALMSSYARPSDASASTSFNLDLDRLETFTGQLCDLYVVAYDESTIEETEAIVRINVGPTPEVVEEEVVEEEELCEDDATVCIEEDEEVVEEEATEEEEVTEEEVVEEEATEEEVVEEETTEEEATE